MPLNVIPFQMPEPMEIPAHLAEQLRQLPVEEAMQRGMELLMQVEVADIMIYERIDGDGQLQIEAVLGKQGPEEAWRERLAAEPFYGAPPGDASGLAGQAFAQGQSLLVMGQVAEGEDVALPPGLAQQLLPTGSGNVGFLYVLTLAAGGRPLGALTLIRAASEGPLNHEQPNITEAMRRLLSELLSAA